MAARHGTISPTLRAGVPFLGGLWGGGLAVVVCTLPCAWGGVAGGSFVRLGRKNPVASPGLVGPFEEEPRIRRGGLRYMVWYGMVWYGMVWYGMAWHGMVGYGMVWYGRVWYGMVWYGRVEEGVVWCGVVWCGLGSMGPGELPLGACGVCCPRGCPSPGPCGRLAPWEGCTIR